MKTLFRTLLIVMVMGVFNPFVQVAIGNTLKPFSQVNKVHVKSSWQEVTDTASILMPKNLRINEGNRTLEDLNNTIRKGESVKIKAGYNPLNFFEFEGFVSSVKRTVPIRVECEDYMYLLKLDNHNVSWKNTNLKTVINHLLTGENLKSKWNAGFDFDLNIANASLGKFSIPNLNGVQALNRIKDVYGLVSFFRIDHLGVDKPVLHVGFPYTESVTDGMKPTYRTGVNVAGWNLEYLNAEDISVRIKAISNLRNGKKRIVQVGDPNGELRTRNYPELPESTLREYALDDLKHIKTSGFRGSLTGFSRPIVKHGEVVKLDDPVYTKETGYHFVEGTELIITERPTIRRIVKLGLTAS